MSHPDHSPSHAAPFVSPTHDVSSLRSNLSALWLADEARCLDPLIDLARLPPERAAYVQRQAEALVQAVRNRAERGVEALLQEYDLSSQEGVVLMCLAEALLRIPDADTADKLIEDKLRDGNWEAHLGHSESLFVNASTWGLMLAGRVLGLDDEATSDLSGYVKRLVARSGESVVRNALRQAMRVLGHQFVMGRTIDEALARADRDANRRYRYSFDMLGEAAITARDAQRYLESYLAAIDAIGARQRSSTDAQRLGISVKLSALHPRYGFAQAERVRRELAPRLLQLACRARDVGIALTVDAEESERLDLSLDLVEMTLRSRELDGYSGFGLAVQAYQKRAVAVIDWVSALADSLGRTIPVRLVKGAYWDSEIKRAQERGLPGYPVFTRKTSTDVAYLACVRKLFAAGARIYRMFATHNAHTLASVIEMAEGRRDFEFQRLHGMGEALYEVALDWFGLPCRVYAPVGSHEDLLPYLVRRLLENGANTSFVHRIADPNVPVVRLTADPVAETQALLERTHPRIPLPRDLYGPQRLNSTGVNLADGFVLDALTREMSAQSHRGWQATPIVNGRGVPGTREAPVRNPADLDEVVGSTSEADEALVDATLAAAAAAQPNWDSKPASERAALLRKAADLFEQQLPALAARCVREAGRTIPDAIAEVREAVDYLRYYAAESIESFGAPRILPGPTGESNELWLEGRGVFACISPWNFPLAIFTGQIVAALAAGNTVVAKPAEQTTLTAALAVQLLHDAGIPGEVLHLLPGRGERIGAALVRDARVAGVAFTGSTATAKAIQRALAGREGTIPVLIAETGGQNAMIADSSALPEQVVIDALSSAFNSAGQRCSALRVLCVQNEIADRVFELLAGAMEELRIGDPARIDTDIGPVIDADAKRALERHLDFIAAQGRIVRALPLPSQCTRGTFFAPVAIEIPSMRLLKEEVFGPVLHLVRFDGNAIDKVIDDINATGYGLTLGIHSRIESQARTIQRRCAVGNVYVNRNMIGAVVGVQPFGGRGLSGTGPKAGGPGYLHAFASERTVSINTAAIGGNATLLGLGE
ncbi:MAG TPA: bifunctional proline dehydrogenase/L-glutamate gamma-semialdehyde dehydrogenase PutA [Burkholderiales bacterium]|nr:bifunctional proline dehydrogenase/L-glutamate gamma-semialdehyde dehydrogenase PutA [Burkholderiales bacterium]